MTRLSTPRGLGFFLSNCPGAGPTQLHWTVLNPILLPCEQRSAVRGGFGPLHQLHVPNTIFCPAFWVNQPKERKLSSRELRENQRHSLGLSVNKQKQNVSH